MTINLIKLCVGFTTVDDLRTWQQSRIKATKKLSNKGRLVHKTRQSPNRHLELLNGGSIYWVIKGVIQARQRLIGFEDDMKDGRKCCALVLDPNLILVKPVPRRPFQGWRYLLDDDVPRDLTEADAKTLANMPDKMRRELLELALL